MAFLPTCAHDGLPPPGGWGPQRPFLELPSILHLIILMQQSVLLWLVACIHRRKAAGTECGARAGFEVARPRLTGGARGTAGRRLRGAPHAAPSGGAAGMTLGQGVGPRVERQACRGAGAPCAAWGRVGQDPMGAPRRADSSSFCARRGPRTHGGVRARAYVLRGCRSLPRGCAEAVLPLRGFSQDLHSGHRGARAAAAARRGRALLSQGLGKELVMACRIRATARPC
jgi:hypothetical protein